MKRFGFAVLFAVSGLLTLSALVFGIWVNQANADFVKAAGQVSQPVVASNEQNDAPKSGYVLQGGKLVKVDAEQLALEAWDKDKLLPGKDMHYNYFEIGKRLADWKESFRSRGLSIDQAFDNAYMAIAHRSEERLKEQAFRSTQ